MKTKMNGRLRATAPLAAGAAAVLLMTFTAVRTGRGTSLTRTMTAAARKTAEARKAVLTGRVRNGPPVDGKADPNRTGFIGLSASSITTSLGNIQAKRTATQPDMAALVVYLLHKAGVGQGDNVAVGASGSFPGLIAATVIAVESMGAKPLVIVSLGSSEWGANILGFGWLEMSECLRGAGVIASAPLAASLGGDEDRGLDMSPAAREALIAEIARMGCPLIDEKGLTAAVAARMKIYRRAACGKPVRAFINIGGSWADLGTNSRVLGLEPGLIRRASAGGRGPAGTIYIPPESDRGTIQAMAAEGVPVVHLLNMRGLVRRYGLAWDPAPLPEPGRGPIYSKAAEEDPTFIAACLVFVFAATGLAFLSRPRFPS